MRRDGAPGSAVPRPAADVPHATRHGRARRFALWLGLVVSLPAAAYLAVACVFYAWLNAAEPERWPAERAAWWVGGSALLAMVCLAVFIACLVSLVRGSNRGARTHKIP